MAVNPYTDLTTTEFLASYTGALSEEDVDPNAPDVIPENATEAPETNTTTMGTTTTKKHSSESHEHEHHRSKRAIASWTVPANWNPEQNYIDLRTPRIPV